MPEALDWLYSTQWFGVKLGLENMRRLLGEACAWPPHGTRVLHVAGTNGKGSVCAMADSIARACGVRTGLFTSPHLVDFGERIRVDGECISPDEIESGLRELRALVVGWDPHPTFFELTLALALRHFERRRCELLILETGMGGRLDATNAVPSDVCVVTPIGMDHQEWLGDTLARIAAEKAGIFKPGVPAFSAPQEPEARAVLQQHASETRCPLVFVEQPLLGYPVALPGRHQRMNAALTVEALHALRVPMHVDNLRAGLAGVSWPGRFDRRPEHRMVLDGAHNPHGAAILAATWNEWYPDAMATLVFSALADKEPEPMLRVLRAIARRVIVCPVDSPRALAPSALAQAALAAGFTPQEISSHESLPSALEAAARWQDPILVTGSLFLVGQTIAFLEKSPIRPSSQ